MCAATSDAQDRVIDNNESREVTMQPQVMFYEPFYQAEMAYRRELLARGFRRRRHPRHWVPRRPSLKLPHPRRRPLAVA